MSLHLIWIKVAEITAKIYSRVLLLAVFYLFVTPWGLLMRLFREDFLGSPIDKGAVSYWQDKKSEPASRESYEKQY